MTDKDQAKKLTTSNTKAEMLEAYNQLLKQLQEKREAELKPQQKLEEKAVKKVVTVADSFSTDGVVKEIGNLRADIGRLLNQLSDNMQEEVNKYLDVKKAIEAKQQDLREIYEIERAALSLAALIEAQEMKKAQFEIEMQTRKEDLTREMQALRADWDKEKKLHEAELKERDAAEQKRRAREGEEYNYTFKREQQLAQNQFADEKTLLEREIQLRKEVMEQELADRERAIAQQEASLADLRNRVEAFPAELETAIARAAEQATKRAQGEAKMREELLRKEFEGERNVLTTRIETFERIVREQNDHIAKLSQQLEKAYAQVQEIAVKAVEGSSGMKMTATGGSSQG
jgi:hypothetical protein